MRLFWREKKAAARPAEADGRQYPRDLAAQYDECRRNLAHLAKLAEPDALARADDIMRDLREAHEADVAEYRFECRRHGDFLALFMTRVQPNRSAPDRLVVSLNLKSVRSVSLARGHEPDRAGVLFYRAWARSADGKMTSSVDGISSPRTEQQIRDGATVFAAPEYPACGSREMVRDLRSEGRGPHGHPGSCGFLTMGYPRPAMDDAVVFSGLDMAVQAPAGMGLGVFDKIMACVGSAGLGEGE